MKKKIQDKNTIIWSIVVIALLLVYLGIFAYLNLAKYSQHVDSDIAAEALLAREMWEEKTLTPDNWISSTERRIFAMPAVAALFYGMTGSMQLAVGIACVLIGALFFYVLYWFLKKLGVSRLAALTGVLVLCAVPINGIRNEGQMVPFVSLLLFLFAEYYVFHCILLFFSIIFYLHLKEKARIQSKLKRKDMLAWGFLFVLTVMLALGGQRCLQMVILPLVVYEAISLYVDSAGFTSKLSGKRLLATGFVGTSLFAFIVSLVYDRQANYAMYLLTPGEIMNRVFLTVPAALLEGFGIAGNAKVGSFSSLMQLLVWAFLALVVYGVVYTLRKKNGILSRQKEALLLLLASVGISAAIICITTAEPAHNYLMVSWFVALLAIVIVVDAFWQKKSFFVHVILAAVCLFAVLNLKYTWVDAVTTTDNLKDYEEVAEFLLEEGIEYGYAEFWDAERISLIKDGAITMGHAYGMENLQMYWWLTSTDWYPPNLTEDTKTAYVVKLAKKDAFEAQFTEENVVELQFENARFAVYVSDKNLMKIQ